MSNRWIVSAYNFHMHKTLDLALNEQARLKERFPKGEFRIYRVKGDIYPSNAAETIKTMSYLLKKTSEGVILKEEIKTILEKAGSPCPPDQDTKD